jgi:hypothetical protein
VEKKWNIDAFINKTGLLNVKLVKLNVKLPKVGSNVIVPILVGARPNKRHG